MKRNIIKTAKSLTKKVGVTSIHNIDGEVIEDLIQNGIDLTFMEYYNERFEELLKQGHTDFDDIDNIISEETQDFDTDTWLIGDWTLVDGKYSINKDGPEGFAGTYNRDSCNICVEYSQYVILNCHYTSPCYVMADGSGPCGDLDTDGDIMAYCLPPDMFNGGL
ncbi:MAG: hypothetical protein DRN81_05440 [Thermoproteota archaeon]|nr:MAG: hypothetical protein DRN81_05440 [Candidatus Korarchaeota archaeon]